MEPKIVFTVDPQAYRAPIPSQAKAGSPFQLISICIDCLPFSQLDPAKHLLGPMRNLKVNPKSQGGPRVQSIIGKVLKIFGLNVLYCATQTESLR
jgi:hypothetical protein